MPISEDLQEAGIVIGSLTLFCIFYFVINNVFASSPLIAGTRYVLDSRVSQDLAHNYSTKVDTFHTAHGLIQTGTTLRTKVTFAELSSRVPASLDVDATGSVFSRGISWLQSLLPPLYITLLSILVGLVLALYVYCHDQHLKMKIVRLKLDLRDLQCHWRQQLPNKTSGPLLDLRIRLQQSEEDVKQKKNLLNSISEQLAQALSRNDSLRKDMAGLELQNENHRSTIEGLNHRLRQQRSAHVRTSPLSPLAGVFVPQFEESRSNLSISTPTNVGHNSTLIGSRGYRHDDTDGKPIDWQNSGKQLETSGPTGANPGETVRRNDYCESVQYGGEEKDSNEAFNALPLPLKKKKKKKTHRAGRRHNKLGKREEMAREQQDLCSKQKDSGEANDSSDEGSSYQAERSQAGGPTPSRRGMEVGEW